MINLLVIISLAFWVMSNSKLVENYSVAFLHSRKAGGTLILRLLEDWLRIHKCNSKHNERMSVLGVKRGIYQQFRTLHKKEQPNITSPCPYVNVVHQEYGCFDGRLLLSFPDRITRLKENRNITIFTTFRDPMQRVCSQSLYGRYDVTFDIFRDQFSKKCGVTVSRVHFHYQHYFSKCLRTDNNNRKLCDCFMNSLNTTMNILKTDESQWTAWMRRKNGFGDRYASNYYVRRLTCRNSSKDRLHFVSDAIKCANKQNNEENTTNTSCQTWDNYDILRHAFSGVTPSPEVMKKPVPEYALEIAKKLLREQLDFIILEQVRTTATTKATQEALFNTYKFKLTDIKVENGGLANILGVKCMDLMPLSVKEKLEAENSLDIQLYKYAVQLFAERAKANGWGSL